MGQDGPAEPVDSGRHHGEARLDRGHHPAAGHALLHLEIGQAQRLALEAVGELVAAAQRLAEQDPADRQRLLDDAGDVGERLLRRLRDPPPLVSTRRVRTVKRGISANAKRASCQLRNSMAIIVATTVVRLEAMFVAVFVTTFCTPPMSLLIRDCTSPVRVRVKKASESRCRCRKTLARRSCMTRWPTWFESSVWTTPRIPVRIAIAIIPRGDQGDRVRVVRLDRHQQAAEQERRDDAEGGAHDDQSEQDREPPPVRA